MERNEPISLVDFDEVINLLKEKSVVTGPFATLDTISRYDGDFDEVGQAEGDRWYCTIN